ncbi:hypothetical protein EPN81_00895 [Patescibacteria group bacterium]|nr:MAG: hypothetical protein EPN81_00895 [Patescibacteria group bacterium]
MFLTKLELQGFKTFAKKTELSFFPPAKERCPITAVVGPNGSGKCLHGDSRVMLADGRLIQIRSLFEMAENNGGIKEIWEDGYCVRSLPEPIEILSMNPGSLRIEKRTVDAFIKRTSPGFLLQIETRSGKSIRTTHYHPFFTLKNGRLHALKAEELTNGITIATPRILSTDSQETIDENLARFLGYFISEGRNTKNGQVRFVNEDEAVLQDFISVAESSFNRKAHRYSYKQTADDVILYGHDLCERLENEFGILRDGHSRTKSVPPQLFTSPQTVITAFLGALFEGDGHVCAKQYQGRTQAHIEYATASPELADGVVTLLLRLGIVATRKVKMKWATNSPIRKKRPYTSVYIYGTEQLKCFARCIHFAGKKQMSLEVLKTLEAHSNPNLDVVPTAVHLVRETVLSSGLKVKPLRGDFPRLAAYNERRCEASRDGLLDVPFLLQDRWEDEIVGPFVQQLSQLANSDIYWDEITQIQRIDHEDWVYDLSIPFTHNFISENIIVHNSNLADAIRWVLGEQSLKLLRGKESQDVIFSGSEGKGRAGFAQVSLSLNNEDGSMPIDYSHVTITRRLYRGGTSEYLLNESPVRLGDIQLLLAQANVGQRSYSVVGQGMIDHILISTPEERKAFFDDATGVKPFQLKRHEAILKLKRTHENLVDVEMLLREIEPRLRSLKRQASRLEQRDEIQQSLHALEAEYYGGQWWELVRQLEAVKTQFTSADDSIKQERTELTKLEQSADALERAEQRPDTGLIKLQEVYRAVQKKQHALRQKQFQTEKEIELTKVRAQSNWAPLPLVQIMQEVEEVVKGLRGLKGLKDAAAILELVDVVLKRSEKLSKCLQRPNPDDIKPDPVLVQKLKELKGQEGTIQKELEGLEAQIDAHATQEKTERTELIEMQKTLREKQRQIHLLENRRNELQIDLARYEERQQALIREMNEFMKDRALAVRSERPPSQGGLQGVAEDSYAEIQRLRYKLELIGGIDPEIMKEYEETRVRHEFLDSQVSDLHKAIRDTEKVIVELDEQIEKQSKAVFGKINREFERYFKVLFGGGSCQLVKLTREEVEEDVKAVEGVTVERAFADTGEEERDKEDAIVKKLSKHQDPVIGIDIQATPPGKKLKALNLLSGGERALTSIALISAIMAVNPSPFVLLDEVDAALDESNTIRFASILQELSEKSQFIIITHNRATMEQADVLYGVTMGTEGVSNLLSIHLEDVTNNGTTARR